MKLLDKTIEANRICIDSAMLLVQDVSLVATASVYVICCFFLEGFSLATYSSSFHSRHKLLLHM